MFLPDGRVLIMDSELYKQTIERSIVLDLFDGPQLQSLPLEEEKSSGRQPKDVKSKQNQANQRKNKGTAEATQSVNESQTNIPTSQIQPDGSSEDYSQEIKRDLLSLLNQQDFSDITLLVDGNPIYCHQVVLASRSFYFEASLSHDFKEKEQKVVNFTDVNYDSFMTLLRHIYSDTLKIDTKQIY